MRLRLSPSSVARVLRNLGYTPGRDVRFPYTVELDPTDYPVGTVTMAAASLVIAQDFGLPPLYTAQITTIATAAGQITNTGASGVGALAFNVPAAALNALRNLGPLVFEVVVTDSLSRQASLDMGALYPAQSTAGNPVDHVLITPNPFTAAWPATTQLVATAYDLNDAILTGHSVIWSTSDPTIATVDGNGVVTPLAIGAVIITATIDGIAGTATGNIPIGVPATPPQLVAAVNAAGATQITHAWAPGYGHTLTVGRKTDIADFVGGGADGVLHMVPSFTGGGSGINYDPATPDRFTFGGSSMKVVAPTDFGLGVARCFGSVGFMKSADVGYPIQSHNGTGSNEFKVEYGPSGAFGVAKSDQNGAPNSSHSTCATRDDHVRHFGIQWDPTGNGVNPEMQGYVGRDMRTWMGFGDAGATTGFTGSRTMEVGNQYGAGGGNNETGDLRFRYTTNGLLSAAQLKIMNDYFEAQCGAFVDTIPHVPFTGNSLVTTTLAQWAPKLAASLGSGYQVSDLGRSGATWAQLTARAARLEALIDGSKRTKTIPLYYEWTNSSDVVTYPDGPTFYAAAKAAAKVVNDAIAANGGLIEPVGITMLPADIHYTHGSANGLLQDSIRLAANALMAADLKPSGYFNAVANIGANATIGPYAALTPVPNTYYQDGVHTTTAANGGSDIAVADIKTKVLTI